MKNSLLSSFALALVLGSSVVAACGGGDSNSNPQCAGPQGKMSSGECNTCLEAHCSSQYSAFCSAKCSTSDSSSACQNAEGDVISCALSNCTSQCDVTATIGGAGPGSVTIPSRGGSGDGTTITPEGGSPATTGTGAPGNGEVTFACDLAKSGVCTQATIPASVKDTEDKACTDQGGTAADTCPTKDLVGCCTLSGVVETCAYADANGALDEATCTIEGGTWSTKP